MRKEEFFNIIGELDEQKIATAGMVMTEKKKFRPILFKWGVMAACLCLVIVGSTILIQQDFKFSDFGNENGLDGAGEGTSYSVAVYPATENVEDVALAKVVSLTESEALNHPLAKYLPQQLPDGFHYGRGSIYNTVMKDGTQYNMLRIEYISGVIGEQQFTEDGGAIAPDLEAIGSLFLVCVMNYEPETKNNIYSSIDEVTEALFENSGSVCISIEDCYVSVFSETAEPTVVFNVVKEVSGVEEVSSGAPLAPTETVTSLENVSHIEICSGLTNQKITVKASDSVKKVMENIESLMYEKIGAVENTEYVYRIRFYNENYDELGVLYITEKNGHQISYDGYSYLVEADCNINVDYLEELLKDAPPAEPTE